MADIAATTLSAGQAQPELSHSPSTAPTLEQGTYEILRARLSTQGANLRTRLEQLNQARQEVFGAIKTGLIATERVTTKNNCTPRDIIPIGGNRFLFGYNVLVGLRTETQLADVFALYEYRDHHFHELPLDALSSGQFETDFKSLYRYYKNTVFTKFSLIGPHLFMEFRVGKSVTDIKTFKWLCEGDQFTYLGNRFDHEYNYPPQHEFEWKRTHRELHRSGLHPHISVEDRVFVECVGGDLTVKVEDNTETGEGIYSEPVEQKDQTLDDAEIFYASVGNLILLKIRPYQEKKFRYHVFNEKQKEVRRIDAIEDSCVLLPDGHGIIFARGYYLQSGEFKQFETELSDMVFYKRIPSPNGEDFLYSFYNRESGDYVLLSYNVISRTVETPIICGGFSLFENGEVALFRNESEPQKHHAIQMWQTPYVGPTWQPEVHPTNFLYKIGNPELVGAMAECGEILTLLGKDDSYAGLYLDLVKRTGDILDSYFWLDREEAFDLSAPLDEIRKAASSALAEFDKVVAIKKNTAAEIHRIISKTDKLLQALPREQFTAIGQFITRLGELRAVRGELISAKELRYADIPALEQREKDVAAAADTLAQSTVEFLLAPEALTPVRERVDTLNAAVPALPKVTDAQKLDEEISGAAKELDLLIETVSNLKIQDATETTRIVENVSTIYSVLNQARAGLKQRIRDLRGTEAVAEFASQSRLLDQALTNYLDLCSTPEKCDEYLNRLMLQIEELEARFSDFDEFVVQLSENRTAVSGAFETRKLELVETRNRKANTLLTAAERILKGIKHRADSLGSTDEIHSYFAADLMVDKVRDQVRRLIELGDTVKADDLQSRLKTIREDAVRQLKDRQELFVGGANVIQLGRHQFLTNTQALDLTIIPRRDDMCLHLTGTNFFAPVTDGPFLATRPVWNLDVSSETPEIYRAEYLAYKMLTALQGEGHLESAAAWSENERSAAVREFMTPRYSEGYVKGVHDHDAGKILAALIEMHAGLGLLRYPTQARVCAAVFWHQYSDNERKALLTAKLHGYAKMMQLFPKRSAQTAYIRELHALLSEWVKRTGLFDEKWLPDAAEYLYFQIKQTSAGQTDFVISPEAANLFRSFEQHLVAHHFSDSFSAARQAVQADLSTTFELHRDWVSGYVSHHASPELADSIDEVAWLLLRGEPLGGGVIETSISRTVEGLVGSHSRIQNGCIHLHYVDFQQRLRAHDLLVVPQFEQLQHLKRDLIEQSRTKLRLDDFKPRVLTSFVRNRLIDSVYLPLVGDNLAKQIGAAGDAKRTDRMGLLLLVSPPGYGKTTLLEYVASRLGIVFMKVNGPAIGHRVTSLDPAEAPNAAARDELNKLNLAFEMGDNVMVCLDDIQHLNPEFLQKFISLCDGQRRIEGVYRGEPRTYDLRGKKVVVVMAGNPYTESGEKFRVPDMLANRADTYNLGDVIGGHADAFKASYLENAATSNPTLARLAARSTKDIFTAIQLAESGPREGLDFEGNYSPEEQSEVIEVMKKLLRVRDVVLKVNEEYIRSAAQADAYRTEPPFKLQGSYRNMNRLAEKVSAVMNDEELEALIQDHYRNEAQTLTTGAEANLLKLRELTGKLTPEEASRWEEIKTTFRKKQLLRGGDERDPITQVVRQLSACFEAIDSIKQVLAAGLKEPIAPPPSQPVTLIMGQGPMQASPDGNDETPSIREVSVSPEALKRIWEVIEQTKPSNGTSSNVGNAS
ncbi:DNA repair ATPase [Verrucomicrobiota bacterium sgz303538]